MATPQEAAGGDMSVKRAISVAPWSLLAALVCFPTTTLAAPDGTRTPGDASWSQEAPTGEHGLVIETSGSAGVSGSLERAERGAPLAGHAFKVDVDLALVEKRRRGESGESVRRVRVSSPDALWIVLGFGTFRVPEGASLSVLAADGSVVAGPYGADDVRRHGQLWTPPIEGDEALVELAWPAALDDVEPNVHLGTVAHGFAPWGGLGESDDPGTDVGDCHVDVKCPLGDAWRDQRRGVVNLLKGGVQYCSGTFVTTADGSCKPYVLSANHCLSTPADAAATSFQTNFERKECGGTETREGPIFTGSALVATWAESDVTLLELDQDVPAETRIFLNGYNRAAFPPAVQSWVIHHPDGREKSISFNADPVTNGVSYGPSHWRVSEWEEGSTEFGSSGGPLFDQDQRIVGQLHGGSARCDFPQGYDEFGKFSVSWDGGGTPATRLSDWLDPLTSGEVTVDGVEWNTCLFPPAEIAVVDNECEDTTGNGDGDGHAEPGELVRVPVTITNEGRGDGTELVGWLSVVGGPGTVVDRRAEFPDLAIDETGTSLPPHFTVEIDEGAACGARIDLHVSMSSAEAADVGGGSASLRVGEPSESPVFSDDMENGQNGWSTAVLDGINEWRQRTVDAKSPVHSWLAANVAARGDTVLIMPELTALPASSELRFWHRFDTEANRDGGVLEYDTGSGWADAGPLMVEEPYNGGIASNATSPLAGRSAFSGDSGDWIETVVDLSSLSGQDVRFRWRFATDETFGDEGWYVDDVRVRTVTYSCDVATPRPGEASARDASGRAFHIEKEPTAGYRLTWSAPESGGPFGAYRLYGMPLLGVGAIGDPVCEGRLGDAPLDEVVLAELTPNTGFLVVPVNETSGLEGPYGTDSEGRERWPAEGPAVCP